MNCYGRCHICGATIRDTKCPEQNNLRRHPRPNHRHPFLKKYTA